MVLVRAMKGRFVTANESETSAIQAGEAAAADEERWLTYLNYDQSIQQAVRRLGALSSRNVDEFRSLFLKSRDRSRVKEYEEESIRRLQGEAFVGDEELQRVLIVLHAEDPRLGEAFQQLVARTGRPTNLDEAIAAIRGPQIAKPRAPKPETPKLEVSKPETDKPERTSPPAPVSVPASAPMKGDAREAVVVPLRKDRAVAPVSEKQAEPRPVSKDREAETKPFPKQRVAIGVLVLVAAAGAFFVVPGLIGSKPNAGQTAVSAPPVSADKPQAVAASTTPAVHPASPAVDLAMPAQTDKSPGDKAPAGQVQPDKIQASKSMPESPPASPPLRAASIPPEAPANSGAASQPQAASAPVPGSTYKVMRGDMLSDIALQAYGDASKFHLIQAANPGIHNKDRILVDQVITIPQVSH